MIKVEEIYKIINNSENKKILNLRFKENFDFFIFRDNKLFFLPIKDAEFLERNNDMLINRIKLFFKKYPKIFRFLYNLFGATFVGKSPAKFLSNKGKDAVILNIGSGTKKINDDTINLDSYPFENVDIIADATDLPLADESVDIVVNEFILEHVSSPEKVVSEITRILKPGGTVYIAVPFVASFHSSPNDYYRWSKNGFRELLKDFDEEECEIRCGPTSALIYVLSEWLGTILSLGSLRLQQIWFMFFLVIFSPLNLVDYLIYKLPSSENIAYGFYFIGRKK